MDMGAFLSLDGLFFAEILTSNKTATRINVSKISKVGVLDEAKTTVYYSYHRLPIALGITTLCNRLKREETTDQL